MLGHMGSDLDQIIERHLQSTVTCAGSPQCFLNEGAQRQNSLAAQGRVAAKRDNRQRPYRLDYLRRSIFKCGSQRMNLSRVHIQELETYRRDYRRSSLSAHIDGRETAGRARKRERRSMRHQGCWYVEGSSATQAALPCQPLWEHLPSHFPGGNGNSIHLIEPGLFRSPASHQTLRSPR